MSLRSRVPSRGVFLSRDSGRSKQTYRRVSTRTISFHGFRPLLVPHKPETPGSRGEPLLVKRFNGVGTKPVTHSTTAVDFACGPDHVHVDDPYHVRGKDGTRFSKQDTPSPVVSTRPHRYPSVDVRWGQIL